jgi:hypothetical protein
LKVYYELKVVAETEKCFHKNVEAFILITIGAVPLKFNENNKHLVRKINMKSN